MRNIVVALSLAFFFQGLVVSTTSAQISPKDFLKERQRRKFCRANPDAEKCADIKEEKAKRHAFAEFCKKNRQDEKCIQAREKQRAELEQFCVEQPDALYCKRKHAADK